MLHTMDISNYIIPCAFSINVCPCPAEFATAPDAYVAAAVVVLLELLAATPLTTIVPPTTATVAVIPNYATSMAASESDEVVFSSSVTSIS